MVLLSFLLIGEHDLEKGGVPYTVFFGGHHVHLFVDWNYETLELFVDLGYGGRMADPFIH